jgi:hypothetical protein
MSPKIAALMVGVAAGLALAGCSNNAARAPQDVQPRMPPLAPIQSCTAKGVPTNLAPPTTVFKVKVFQTMKFWPLGRFISTRSADPGNSNGDDYEGNGPDTDDTNDSVVDPKQYNKTQWDMAINLKDLSSQNKTATALIKVIAGDGNVKIRNDKFAVTSGDDNAKYMICGFGSNSGHPDDFIVHGGKGGQDYAIFKVFYNSQYPISSINVGFYIKNGDYTVPIFIDPSIKNNG